jgi:hypothetical protein
MILTTVTPMLALAIATVANVIGINIDTSGFLNPQLLYSVGGHTVCVDGIVPVGVSDANNVQLDLPSSINQTQTMQLVLSLFSANLTVVAQVTRPNAQIWQTFNISVRLCYPENATGGKQSTV